MTQMDVMFGINRIIFGQKIIGIKNYGIVYDLKLEKLFEKYVKIVYCSKENEFLLKFYAKLHKNSYKIGSNSDIKRFKSY